MNLSNPPPDRSETSRPWILSWSFGAAACIALAVVAAACGSAPTETSPAAGDAQAPSTQADPGSTATVDEADTTAPSIAPSTDATTDASTDATSVPAPASTTASTEAQLPAPAGVSFAADIQPIISETCARCHTGNGPGTQHVRFDTADDVARTAFAVAIVAESGAMPPWPASDEGVAMKHDWSLSDEEIADIIDWNDAGGPLDVAPDTPMQPTQGLIGLQNPELTMQSQGAYDGELGQPDTYRCLIYDPQLDATKFAQSMEFIPQQTQVVHHAVTFLISGEDRAALDAKSGSDGQGGWTCNGFSPAPSAEIVFTWAPGQPPTRYEDGTGLRVDAGDFFVSQTHYHYDVEAPADQSQMSVDWAEGDNIRPVAFEPFYGPAEIPCRADESGPLCSRDAALAQAVALFGQEGVLANAFLAACGYTPEDFAGMTDGIATSTCDRNIATYGELVSVFGHQHELGTSVRVTLNPDTADELILLDIPKWDFNWQLIYEPEETIVFKAGDVVRIECAWDRALRNPDLEPAYVLWSEATTDEMCYGSFMIRT